jgi:hypothetical protein
LTLDLTPEERSLRARIGANQSWANTADPSARTAPARKAFNDRFEKQVDPDGQLKPAERARRAESARKAYFLRLALKSSTGRRKAAEARATATQLEREADDAESELAGTVAI